MSDERVGRSSFILHRSSFMLSVGSIRKGVHVERFSALIGFVVILAIAYLLSNNRKAIRWRIVFWGLLLQILIAIAVLKGELISSWFQAIALPISRNVAAIVFVVLAIVIYQVAIRLPLASRRYLWYGFGVVSLYLFLSYNLLAYLFERLKEIVNVLISYTGEGSKFVFGELGVQNSPKIGFIFATQVLPTIIFIASIFAVLYYLGVMQLVVKFFAKIMTRFMGASGAESTSVAASIFMGQTEAPLTIRPFLAGLTQSELFTIMTSGMAHVSGAVMAAYVLIAHVEIRHLLTAVIMTSPATLMLAKILIPETGQPATMGGVKVDVEKPGVNVIDAAARGAGDGLHLALNIGAMLIAFIGLIALVNGILGSIHSTRVFWWIPGSMQEILARVFAPIAWLL